jgi:hypothetical protein
MDLETTPQEVQQKLERGEPLVLLDVREPWEYEVARIEGSRLMPMGDVPVRAHQELDPDEHIVVICLTECARRMWPTGCVNRDLRTANRCVVALTCGRAW